MEGGGVGTVTGGRFLAKGSLKSLNNVLQNAFKMLCHSQPPVMGPRCSALSDIPYFGK